MAGARLLLCALMLAPLLQVEAQGSQAAAGDTSAQGDRRLWLFQPGSEVWKRPAPLVSRLRFETSRGVFVLELHRDWGPLGADRLYNLVRLGYFDDTRFHRVSSNYIVQWGLHGTPQVNALWKENTLPDDPPRSTNTRGTFAFAQMGPNTRNTQIYINLRNNPRSDAEPFTVLGTVAEGMSVLDSLYSGYGENSGSGMRQGRQGPLAEGGNAYMDREFPLLDRIVRATVDSQSNAASEVLQSAPPAGVQQRTEQQARETAARQRAERERQRSETGQPVELISNYAAAAIESVPESLGVSSFYTKYVDALGIPVLSSAQVPDAALLVARDIINSMLAARPDVRQALIDRRWRTGVIAELEMTMDIPEYSRLKRPGAPQGEPVVQADRDYHANRSRGLGGNPTTGAEENLLGYPGTRYFGEHIFVHEFAHAIMTGIRTAEPELHAAIRVAYDSAMAAGLYRYADGRTHYATTNANEYWAEGVQWWFFSNYGECFSGNVHVETPEEFATYDPRLNALIARVFQTHRIPMDVFHARRVRSRTCEAGG